MTISRNLSILAEGASSTGVLGTANGGTALTGFTASNNAIYSTSASALTAGTLPIAAGGTGATTLAGANIPVLNVSNTFTGTQTFNGTTSVFATILANAAETTNIVAGAINSTPTAYFNTGSVVYYTTATSANWTQNLAFSSSTTMNTALAIGQTVTIAILTTQSGTAYYMNGTLTIDGTSSGVTTYWQGGTAPTKGYASGIDVYAYSITKTASATYLVLASQTQF
jgi:hypothetical protein